VRHTAKTAELCSLLAAQSGVENAIHCATVLSAHAPYYYSVSGPLEIEETRETYRRRAAALHDGIEGLETLAAALDRAREEKVSVHWIVAETEWFLAVTDSETASLLGIVHGVSEQVYAQYRRYVDLAEPGDKLHDELMGAFAHESEAWANERIERVETQLQFHRFPAPRLRVEILWVDMMTAFTAPGRYIYISRELLQCLATDDAAAFVIAHEIAHHDLGHIDPFTGQMKALAHLPGGLLIASLIWLIEERLHSPEREMKADAAALDLCLRAGYESRKCLAVFDVLEAHALDMGDIDIVYGPPGVEEASEQGIHNWLTQYRQWRWQRGRGYLSIRDRKEALEARLASPSG